MPLSPKIDKKVCPFLQEDRQWSADVKTLVQNIRFDQPEITPGVDPKTVQELTKAELRSTMPVQKGLLFL